jgi:sugar/nucleoside kinase (ribokinase family)
VPKLLIIGDVGLDLVLGPVDAMPAIGTEALVDRAEIRSGFSAANSALAARHLGQACQLVGAIGDDDLGRVLVERLAGIDARLFVTPGHATTLTVALVRGDGERSFLTTRGHLEAVGWDKIIARVDPAGDGDIALLTGFFLLPTMRAAHGEYLRKLRALGYRIAVDTGWPPEGWTPEVRAEVTGWLPLCDLILLNEIEVLGLGQDQRVEVSLNHIASCLAPGGVAVAKLGAQGAAALTGGEIFRGSAPAVSVFDSVGAGDSFNAAFLAASQNGLPLEAALTAGCAGASTIIARFPRSDIAPGSLANLVAAR